MAPTRFWVVVFSGHDLYEKLYYKVTIVTCC